MKIKGLIFSVFLLAIISCSKNKTTNTPTQDKYVTTTTGSTWNYHVLDKSDTTAPPVNTDYTLTSTSRDSSINGKSYHIYSNSAGGNEYLAITGNDYYQFDSLPADLGASVFERLYLKDNAVVGASWTQNLNLTLTGFPVPVPADVNNTITETGITRTVNGNNYTDVIHVVTGIRSTLIPVATFFTNIDSYYAKKYGLIETTVVIQLNYLGISINIDTETKLVNASIL